MSRDERHFCSTLSPGFHQHGPPISAYKFKLPPRVSDPPSFASLLCSTLAIPHHCFLSHTNSSANEPRLTPPLPPSLKRPPHGFPLASALSLSFSLPPAFRHSDILGSTLADE